MTTAGIGSEGDRRDPPSQGVAHDAGAPRESPGPSSGSEPVRRAARAAQLPEDLWRPASWTTRALPPPSNPAWTEWAAVALVVAYNPLANEVIPEPLYIPANLLAAAALAWLAWRSGATADLLGMRRDRATRGLVVGLKAAALAVFAIGLLTALPFTRSYLADDRFIGVPGTEVLYETLGRIPLGTAVGEEIIFRGVLLGLLLRRFTVRGAVLASTLLFGLWHILPTLNSLETNPAGDVLDSPAGVVAAVAGAVVTTSVAGVVFAWLRFRASSLVAPIMLHLAINSSAYVAGWLVMSNGWAS